MAMVILKVALIVLVIGAGISYVDTANWHPFIPENVAPGKYGWEGVLRGASMVFFAYIGFEAVSVAAQESHNPARNMPIGMLASLAICTVLYIGMALVMTGLTPFGMLGTAEPVVTAVASHPELSWLRWIVEIGAMIGLASVVLVMIIGQPRGTHRVGKGSAAGVAHRGHMVDVDPEPQRSGRIPSCHFSPLPPAALLSLRV